MSELPADHLLLSEITVGQFRALMAHVLTQRDEPTAPAVLDHTRLLRLGELARHVGVGVTTIRHRCRAFGVPLLDVQGRPLGPEEAGTHAAHVRVRLCDWQSANPRHAGTLRSPAHLFTAYRARRK
jgi:hypothetical protein